MGYGADAAKRAGGSGRIDLRSDTVTHPTPEMRRAMASAEVGDDVFEDDPTVAELEERAADLLGKEAGLFVASGTMGNLVSVMAHVPRGGEIITPAEGHIPNDEAANYAVVAGAGLRTIRENPDGEMPVNDVIEAIQDASDPHSAITSLVVVENCHAHTFSRPITPAYMKELRAALKPSGIPIHVDGARLFNAVVGLGVSARDLVKDAESATFCLSKGSPHRSAALLLGRRTLSLGHDAHANCLAVACARLGSLRRRASLRFQMAQRGRFSDSLKTTPTHESSRKHLLK